jgi:hypothetical protein
VAGIFIVLRPIPATTTSGGGGGRGGGKGEPLRVPANGSEGEGYKYFLCPVLPHQFI